MRLTDTDLLKELAKPEHAVVRAAFISRRYARGSQVFLPREARNCLFIVAKGRARVYLANRDKEFTMAVLDAGDVYTTHTRAHVEAVDDLELLVADLAAVGPSLLTVPALTASTIKVLGDLLSHAFTVIDGLAFQDARGRLLSLLRYEGYRATPDAAGVPCFAHGLSVEQLATFVGASRQTVSSLLNALEREGIVELRARGVIRILDPAALEGLPDS